MTSVPGRMVGMGMPNPDDLQPFGAGRLVGLHEILRMQVVSVVGPVDIAVSRLHDAYYDRLLRVLPPN